MVWTYWRVAWKRTSSLASIVTLVGRMLTEILAPANSSSTLMRISSSVVVWRHVYSVYFLPSPAVLMYSTAACVGLSALKNNAPAPFRTYLPASFLVPYLYLVPYLDSAFKSKTPPPETPPLASLCYEHGFNESAARTVCNGLRVPVNLRSTTTHGTQHSSKWPVATR